MALIETTRLVAHGGGERGGRAERLLVLQRDGEEEDPVAALIEHAVQVTHTRLGWLLHQSQVLVEEQHGEVERRLRGALRHAAALHAAADQVGEQLRGHKLSKERLQGARRSLHEAVHLEHVAKRATRVVAALSRAQHVAVAADEPAVEVQHRGEENGAVLLVQLWESVVRVGTAPPLLPLSRVLCVLRVLRVLYVLCVLYVLYVLYVLHVLCVLYVLRVHAGEERLLDGLEGGEHGRGEV